MKKIFILLLFSFFMLPTIVNARTLEEANQIFAEFDDEITVNITDPDLVKGYKLYSKEEYINTHSWMADYSDEEIESSLITANNNIKENYYRAVGNFYLKSINYNYIHVIDITFPTNNMMQLSINYNDENDYGNVHTLQKNIVVNYNPQNEEIYNQATNIINQIGDSYIISGMNSINATYHYGQLLEGDYYNGGILGRFSELKSIIENNPDFTYDIILSSGGGAPGRQEREVYIGVYKNEYLYTYKKIYLIVENTLLIDKDLEGTIEEKTLDRLNDYFSGKVNIIIDSDNMYDYSIATSDFERIHEITPITKAISFPITIDDKTFNILVFETDKSNIDKMYMKSMDSTTGVNVYSESYDVPVDAKIESSDVLSEEYVKKAEYDNNLSFIKAFDLKLFKGFNNVLISNFDNGITVYFPINEKIDTDVYHIKNDGSLGEKIDTSFAVIDGKKYISFRTNHFSTFAINDASTNTNGNPNTGDAINTYISILSLSLIVVYFIYKKR